MSPLERDILRRKLERITTNLRLLETVRGISLSDYETDIYRRKAVERLLQEIVEAAVDINSHVLVQAGRGGPPRMTSTRASLHLETSASWSRSLRRALPLRRACGTGSCMNMT